jgi:hypothetical protein
MLAMLALTWALPISVAQTPASATSIDASTLKVGTPATVVELDLGKLKGDLRQIGWSPDGAELYVQTADGAPASEKLRHYLVAVAGGTVTPVDTEPEWARAYWDVKSDRFAPGIGSLMIDFEQKLEKTKIGTGTGRPGATGSGGLGDIGVDVEKTSEGQRQNIARLTLLGETISEFVNQMPIPGLMFSWGPAFSGAIAYTERQFGQLMLLDRNGHKQTVSGVKDALLPAWSIDGTRLAWAQKSGRRKYALVWASVSKS